MRNLRRKIGTVWISKSALAFIAKEFRRAYPSETGGVLIGYLAGSDDAVITCAVGPGPLAKHSETRFVPDWSYHDVEIARLYEESGRLHTYLGDWHSHPNSPTRLSSTDRQTLLRIAKHADARIATPLMVVIAQVNPLILDVWKYYPARALGLISDKIVSLKVRKFSWSAT